MPVLKQFWVLLKHTTIHLYCENAYGLLFVSVFLWLYNILQCFVIHAYWTANYMTIFSLLYVQFINFFIDDYQAGRLNLYTHYRVRWPAYVASGFIVYYSFMLLAFI